MWGNRIIEGRKRHGRTGKRKGKMPAPRALPIRPQTRKSSTRSGDGPDQTQKQEPENDPFKTIYYIKPSIKNDEINRRKEVRK